MNKYKEAMSEVHKVGLNILKAVKAICEKHCLQYYLYSGTLLGAVRHKGFIPWDDDVDILMPREDYERFLEIARIELPQHLFLQHYTTDKGYYLLIAKVRDSKTTLIEPAGFDCRCMHQGIFADIFPLDNMPESALIRWVQLKVIKLLWKIYFMKKHPYYSDQNIWQKIHQTFYKLLPIRSRFLAVLHTKVCKASQNSKGTYVGSISHGPSSTRVSLRKWFEKPVKMQFEDDFFDCPSNYREVLTQAYGDYMELPPENMRIPKHFIMCDPLKPYTDYIKGYIKGTKSSSLANQAGSELQLIK